MDEPGPSSLAAAPSYAGHWSTLKPRLHPVLEEHVASTMGFAQMTPVQSSVIPLFLSYKDVIVEAVTGSGKTMAYVLPVLQMLDRRNSTDHGSGALKKGQVGALIVCPTRELAIQVHSVIDDILKLGVGDGAGDGNGNQEKGDVEGADDTDQMIAPPHSLPQLAVSAALLTVGGSTSSPADDYRSFRTSAASIVVGTPGRIEELMKRSGVDLKELEVLILDEADRLLDMGFQQSISNILQMLPKQRRTGLFSATMTDALGELARVGLRNPVRVVVKVESKRQRAVDSVVSAPSSTTTDKRMPATLESYYLVSRPEHKMLQLLRLLQREVRRPVEELPMRKAIVYFATCAQVNYFYKVVSMQSECAGLKLYPLHGKQTPQRRRATYESFVNATPLGSATVASDEQASILFCTDVAARGLDLPSVDLVVQYDPPTDPKVFSHRCGRTARAGRRGRAIVLLHHGREEDYVEFLRVRKNPVRLYPYLRAPVASGEGQHAPIPSPEPMPVGLLPQSADDVNIDQGALALHRSMRSSVQADRALYELGMQAFVSFVQAYRKHEVSFVFREKDLDMAALAFCYGLLHLPSMPEVASWRKRQQAQSVTPASAFVEMRVDGDTYAYADKLRETQRLATRQAALAKKAQAAQDATKLVQPQQTRKKAASAASAWSDQTARKERRQERRDKKSRKRAFLAKQQEQAHSHGGAGAAKESGVSVDPHVGRAAVSSDGSDDDDDDDDWAAEERQAKKAKRAIIVARGQAKTQSMQQDFDFGEL